MGKDLERVLSRHKHVGDIHLGKEKIMIDWWNDRLDRIRRWVYGDIFKEVDAAIRDLRDTLSDVSSERDVAVAKNDRISAEVVQLRIVNKQLQDKVSKFKGTLEDFRRLMDEYQ